MTNVPILVVEDDLLSNLEICESLRESGFEVLEVSGARSAYQVLEKSRPLQALVTDVNLGPGADGYEIARFARAAYPNLAVIYVSASSAHRKIKEGVARSEFIAKPYEARDVVAALHRTIAIEAA